MILDRVTDKHRVSSQNYCNLISKLSKKIPEKFHNLREYDIHLITQKIEKF